MISFLACALGLMIIGQMVALLTRVGAQNLVGTVMVTVVVRELGPLAAALVVLARVGAAYVFFFSSRRRHTRSVSAFLLNRSSDLHSFATRMTLFHVLVGCGLLMLKVSRLKLPVIWLLVSMWLNTLTKSQIWTLLLKV